MTPWLYKIDSVLPIEPVVEMEDTLLGSYFPWYWNEYTLYEDDCVDFDKTVSQFTHVFYVDGNPNSELNAFAENILAVIEARTPIRITHVERTKANLLCSVGDVDFDQRHEIHSDITEGDDWYSAVYYVGVSDGDTVFFSDDEVETGRSAHERNSLVVFKSKMKHRASLPRRHKRRVVINLVFKGNHG
jgi:hypothetical protein